MKTTAQPQVTGSFLTFPGQDSNPGSGEGQLAVSGIALDHTAIRAGRWEDCLNMETFVGEWLSCFCKKKKRKKKVFVIKLAFFSPILVEKTPFTCQMNHGMVWLIF